MNFTFCSTKTKLYKIGPQTTAIRVQQLRVSCSLASGNELTAYFEFSEAGGICGLRMGCETHAWFSWFVAVLSVFKSHSLDYIIVVDQPF